MLMEKRLLLLAATAAAGSPGRRFRRALSGRIQQIFRARSHDRGLHLRERGIEVAIGGHVEHRFALRVEVDAVDRDAAFAGAERRLAVVGDHEVAEIVHEERVVAGAPSVRHGIERQDRGVALRPGFQVEQVGVLVRGEQAERVGVAARVAAGEGQVDLAVRIERIRALVVDGVSTPGFFSSIVPM